ncbi:MAG: DUF1801 domain-containing protein [Bacteroidota bacterium]
MKSETNPSPTQSVDDYIAAAPAATHAVLQALRHAIKEAAPNASEIISYQIPTYKYAGSPLVHFAVQKNHCSFTVVTATAIEAFREELKGFKLSGRTVQFQPDKPLPEDLVKRIVAMRVAENEAMLKAKH